MSKSFYQMGLEADSIQTTPKLKIGEDKPAPADNASPIKIGLMIGAIGLAIYLITIRKREEPKGPDTSDIEAKLIAKGRDPYLYGFTSRPMR